MQNIITIGYITEGSTDVRFLHAIVRKTFEHVALQREADIDVYEPIALSTATDKSFTEKVLYASHSAARDGLYVLCVHTDADASTDADVFQFKVNPAFDAAGSLEGSPRLVAVVPVRMTEAWMLADIELFKKEISTTLSKQDLGLQRAPETIANPKGVIEEALRLAQDHLPARRTRLKIADLYQLLGQKISFEKLEQLPSFQKFRQAVEAAFDGLNYL